MHPALSAVVFPVEPASGTVSSHNPAQVESRSLRLPDRVPIPRRCLSFHFRLRGSRSGSGAFCTIFPLGTATHTLSSRCLRLSGIQFSTTNLSRLKRHPLFQFVALRPQKPERQTACIVRRRWSAGLRSTYSQRALATGFLPAATHHDHPHHNSNGLPQSLTAIRMHSQKKRIDLRLSLQFPHHASHRRTVMMYLRFFHATLSIRVTEKLQNDIQRLLGIVHHICECSSLSILSKDFACDPEVLHVAISQRERAVVPRHRNWMATFCKCNNGISRSVKSEGQRRDQCRAVRQQRELEVAWSQGLTTTSRPLQPTRRAVCQCLAKTG